MADQKQPGDVHVDLLAIDMETGAHWLDPVKKNKHKLDAIRERNRAKWIAEGKADAEAPSK